MHRVGLIIYPMNFFPHKWIYLVVFIALLGWYSVPVSSEQTVDADWRQQLDAPYTKKGADRCLKCHDEDNEYPVLPIFQSKHGQFSNPLSPMSGHQCETCHGPGGLHIKRPKRGELRAPIMNFGRKSSAPATEQNKVCLQCHRSNARLGWHGSRHESHGLACANCHTIHMAQDFVFDRKRQAGICYRCHRKQRSEFQKAYSHPLRFGQVVCTDCHNTHDAMNDHLLQAATENETCFQCHAEKRGPYLWEHAPVTEQCSLCHIPHGSNYPALLKKRTPLLCQSCHMQNNDHTNQLYNDEGRLGGNNTDFRNFMLGKACLNCHTRIHGSNHPSGVKLLR